MRIFLPDITTYYKVAIVKTVYNWQKDNKADR